MLNEKQITQLLIDLNSRISSIENGVSNITPESTRKSLEILSDLKNIRSLLVDQVCPVVNNTPSLIDLSFVFNTITQSIAEVNKKICTFQIDDKIAVTEIKTKIDLNQNIIESMLTESSQKIDSVDTKIDAMSTLLNQTEESVSYLINYPVSGLALISAGYTTFNLITGTVTHTDGTESSMSDSSQNYGLNSIRSFAIYTDNPIDITMYGSNSSNMGIAAGSFRLTNTDITRIQIKTTEDTNIWISGSTSISGAPSISFSSDSSIMIPNTIVVGSKTDVSTTATQLTTTSTSINKVITVKVRSLGTGSYIAFGTSTSQPFRLSSVGAALNIDWIDNLNKVYVSTDVGTTGALEWIGA